MKKRMIAFFAMCGLRICGGRRRDGRNAYHCAGSDQRGLYCPHAGLGEGR